MCNRYIFIITFVKFTIQVLVGIVNTSNIRFAQKVFVVGSEGSGSLGILYAAIGVSTGIAPVSYPSPFESHWSFE